MLCYLDKTFCCSPCANMGCNINVKQLKPGGSEHENFTRWGKYFSDGEGPVAVSDFRCEHFIEENKDGNERSSRIT